MALRTWCDPQTGSTLLILARKPARCVVASERNLTQRKLEEERRAGAAGAEVPQKRPISGEKGPAPSRTCKPDGEFQPMPKKVILDKFQ